jgi:hypothetical protein
MRLDKLSGVEVLAGRYVLEVAAGGRIIRKDIELKPGEHSLVAVTVEAAPTSSPATPLALPAAAAVAAVAAAVVIAVKRRRRVIEVKPLTEGDETQVR